MIREKMAQQTIHILLMEESLGNTLLIREPIPETVQQLGLYWRVVRDSSTLA
jgi:hypothetical protein